ncbi:urease accessory protein [Hymenobacter jejuensis]|uniref:Urease accessory protein n=1 Tax=Hymenobacter jejuensis TaxID=2502781 RepID=A0A5B8A1G6_9BACT|nr:urease accessory protein [Hymenobacter jejuensis]QDA61221.1 urease accessory protein [Hymenobacter jejuensis]
MKTLLPILFASVAGMGHAFEADHLLAVGTIISKRDSTLLAIKDGLYWGLGHTTTLVVLGSVIIFSRATFLNSSYFEAAVGAMLVVMGISRLVGKDTFTTSRSPRYQHSFAYTVGLIHGLAGSGALVLFVMSGISDPVWGVAYILIFGLGSMLGMLTVAGLFSIPFTKRMKINRSLRLSAVVLSSGICIVYGSRMIYENLHF